MIGKRKRSESSGSSDSPSDSSTLQTSQASSVSLPLTEENLALLESQTTMAPKTPSKKNAPGVPKTPKTPRRGESVASGASTAKSKAAEQVAKILRIIRVRILEPTTTLPEDVTETTDWIVTNPHDNPDSPNPTGILRILKQNNKENERTLVEQLKRWLAEASQDENEEAGVGSKLEANWKSGCVPILEGTSDEVIKMLQDYYTTSTPRPDVTYGFKFLDEEEEHILSLPAVKKLLDICSGSYFPFFTVEWKSTWFGGNIASAQVQCARNGAAAVAAMHRLYVQAGLGPTPADTMHFSMAIDQYCVYFHVHWRYEDEKGRVFWEMMDFDSYTLRKESNIPAVRSNLYNIFKWGRDTRRQCIKEALANLDIDALVTGNAAMALASPASEDILPSEEAVTTASVNSLTDEGIDSSATSDATSRALETPAGKSPAVFGPERPPPHTPGRNGTVPIGAESRAAQSPTGASPPAKKPRNS
ncbi:hypothetical protein H2201_009143 [Coniosporium apollinis]|uniref:DUF7924 domain-containing protein n=1 Tax=Coniosporium apollinis TaxID=61459 RepID=A0ABQ9NL01_9PEZI|nr:hypothetical protein H2201_009143 [Coniosporium apollinis]